MSRDELVQALSDAEATELALLAQAVENSKQAVIDKPSKANLEAFGLAKKMLAEHMAQKSGALAAEDPGQTFRKKSEALRWLKDQGYLIEKTKFYADCKKGLLKKQGPVFTEKDILAYAVQVDLEKVLEPEKSDSESELDACRLRTKKAIATTAETESERKKIKLAIERGEVVSVDDYNQDFAAAAMILRDSMFQFFEMNAKEIVFLAKGDPKQEAEVQEFLKTKSRAWLHGFSRKKTFEVPTDADG